MAMPDTIDKVRECLRICHEDLDGQIADEIDEAVDDLKRIGVINVDETEPLILSAIKEYVRSKEAPDINTAEIYRKRYEQFIAGLSLSEGYGYRDE